MPSRYTTATTIQMAFERFIPVSISTRVGNSSCAIRDEKPANVSPMKNNTAREDPNIILAKSWGIQINVSPVEAGPLVFMISRTSGSIIPISVLRTANTVPKIMIPDSRETVLFPIAVTNAFLTVPCSAFI